MKYASFFALVLLLSCGEKEQAFTIDDNYLNELQTYQSTLLNDRKPYLQLTDLFKLNSEENTFGSDSSNTFVIDIPALPMRIGSINAFANHVFFTSEMGIEARNEQDSVITSKELTFNEYGNSEKLHFKRLIWQVITRGGEHYLRIWDMENSAVIAFKGFDWYEPNPALIFNAQFTYYSQPKEEHVATQLGVNEQVNFVGKVTFNYNDEEYSLDVQPEGFTIVGDATSTKSTYGGGRYMYLDLPKADSLVVLDFNHLYNPPCAFSEYTTCPLPPKQNVLPFEILAGEEYNNQH
ncbi:MAG TPA: DUF1684 domain-containing protein [Fulvivirga sp.]|nr:DUF1684 domain-containing protein [Fulvivirga sp.]